MRGELFSDVVEPCVHVGTRSWYSVPVSIGIHSALVSTLIVVPFAGPYVFPTPQTVLAFITPPAIPLPPDAALELVPVPASLVRDHVNPEAAPLMAPDNVSDERPVVGATSPTEPRHLTSVRARSDIAVPPASAMTTAMHAPPPVSSEPIRVGGALEEPRKVHHVPPVYPAIARASRQEGTVILEATIARDGRVLRARVLRSNVLFDQAAIDAVRQWRFTTPTLNGVPVDVLMTVTVRFTLR
jgi:protein TonB